VAVWNADLKLRRLIPDTYTIAILDGRKRAAGIA
jgi:hypothetical protein